MSNRAEFLFKLTADHFGAGSFFELTGDPLVGFCEGATRDYVDVPVGIRNLYLVFTKLPLVDSFKLRKDGRIVGVRAYLIGDFRLFLRHQYEAGWRYFHFEYGRKS